MKPVDAVGHFFFAFLDGTGKGAEELTGDSPEPEATGAVGPELAVTVTVCTSNVSKIMHE